MQNVFDLDRAKLLVDGLSREKRTAVVNRPDINGDTPLTVAISYGSFRFVKFLLEECDADTNMRIYDSLQYKECIAPPIYSVYSMP